MSIKWDINNLGLFQILAGLCRDFHSLNNASHHNRVTTDILYLQKSCIKLHSLTLESVSYL